MRLAALAVAFALLAGGALAEDYDISRENAEHFGRLLMALLHAYERPSEGDAESIEQALNDIEKVSASDGAVARAIARHWLRVYCGDYELCLYDGGDAAAALAGSGIPDSPTHAFVVLGYALENGEMTAELKGRCDAAAAAAQAYPSAILMCSGGPTGANNPQGHTEAGLMRDYLVNERGIDAGRVYVDEAAMTTVENAVNTFEMMRAQGVRTMTVVTSAYHQRWGQAIYNAMAAFYRQGCGYDVELVGDYSFDIEPMDEFLRDDRYAIRQLASMLKLPKSVLEAMQKAL